MINEMNNQETTALVAMEENNNFVADLTATRKTQFCSMVAKTDKEKATLFNAMNSPEKRIGDCINEIINAKDIFCETVTCINRDTGECTECPRIVIIDDKGVGYQAVSMGVFSAMKKILGVFGTPTWETPIKLKVKQISKAADRKILTFEVVPPTK
jgi:hypothetical protein